MGQSLHVAFCGGGSGGHLTPAISIAEVLQRRLPGVELSFFTSARAVDQQILAAWTTAPVASAVTPLPMRSSANRLKYAFNLMRATWQCRKHFGAARPHVIVGLGGFASVPGVVAGYRQRIPLVLLEPNCIPGKANQWLSRWAEATLSGWPLASSYRDRWRSPLVETGVPIRESFCSLPLQARAKSSPRTLLILGGSLGARSLNDIVLRAVVNCRCLPDDWHVVHQTGSDECARVDAAYAAAAVSASVTAFVADVPSAMGGADLIVSRAGAVTLAEIAATGTAAVLVPLPSAADDHQRYNAESYAHSGAAEVVCRHGEETGEQAVETLAAALRRLCCSDHARTAMEQSAGSLSRPHAAEHAADHLLKYAPQR